jgi:propionyl-CoA synthetase
MTVWEDEERYQKSYLGFYKGYYLTGDSGYIDEDGYVWVMGRMDGVINVAGHRLSTGEMEEVIAKHPDVAECAVVGIKDQLKGEVPAGFVVLKEGIERDDCSIADAVCQLVRDEIGAVASFKIASVVKRLPKTRSGKILRGTMKSIADGTPWNMPSTIEDESVLAEIEENIKALGYPKA